MYSWSFVCQYGQMTVLTEKYYVFNTESQNSTNYIRTKSFITGLLNPEIIKNRKQKNNLNIIMTFWVWFAQFVNNIIYMVLIKMFLGKVRFYHSLLAVLTIFVNFNVLPLFYIVIADEDFKMAIVQKEYLIVAKLFLRG
jgi:hypothetical protein